MMTDPDTMATTPDRSKLATLFKAGQGVAPPKLAGREAELVKPGSFLAGLVNNEPPPRDIVLFGPRGNGKTVLLGAFEAECTAGKKADVIALTPFQVKTDADLAALLLYDEPGLKERLKPDSSGVNVGIFNIQWDSMSPAERDEHTRRHLVDLLRARCGQRPLVVTLDEAHTLDPEIGRTLLNASQLARRQGARFLLVLAGTPDLQAHLDSISATFWDRSEIIGVGRLSAAATEEALVEPLARFGIVFDADALAQVVDESQQYPYFIQVWGEALCDVIIARRVERTDTELVAAARPAFETNRVRYYQKRYKEMDNRDLLPAARVVAEQFRTASVRDDSALQAALKNNLSLDAPAAREALRQLAHLGFTWEPPGSVTTEPGIPSLMDHVLATAPVPEP